MNTKRLQILIVVLVALLSAWRSWRSPWNASNLEIVPDSVEYAVAADRLVTHQGYSLSIDGVKHPPRYPPWFSVGLIAPVLFFAHGELGAAILPVFALGIVSVLAAFAIGKRLSGTWGAVGAALALVLNFAFAALSRLVMTEVPSLAFGLAGCWLFLGLNAPGGQGEDGAAEPPLRLALLAGVLGAAGFALRSESLAILLPFGWRFLRGRRPGPALALLAMPSLVVAAASAWYNAATFGSWRRSGYNYWCANIYDHLGSTFGLRFIPRNVERLLAPSPLVVFLVGLVGAVVLLVLHREGARRALQYVALAALPGTLLHFVYFYPETRFHIFLLALASVIGGAGLGSLAGRALRERLWPIPLVLGLAAFVPPVHGVPLPHRRLVAEALAEETPKDAVIVTGLDPVFLEPHLLRGTSRTIVPASRSVEYASKRFAPKPSQAIEACSVVATESPDRILAFVRDGKRVFVDVSFLPADARLDRILDPSLEVVQNPRFPWLGELRRRGQDNGGR